MYQNQAWKAAESLRISVVEGQNLGEILRIHQKVYNQRYISLNLEPGIFDFSYPMTFGSDVGSGHLAIHIIVDKLLAIDSSYLSLPVDFSGS